MVQRKIIHIDMDAFYASVEQRDHPELRGKPVVVGGDPEARHGIVLTANYIAKRAGIKTGMALWQARQVCPEIIFCTASHGSLFEVFPNGTGDLQ